MAADTPKIPALTQGEIEAAANTDSKSAAESKQLSSGKSEDALRKEAERTERFRDHFERLSLVTLYLVWAVLMILGAVWIYHLIAPPSWHRLPDEQVRNIQSIVTGGFLAGLASGHLKRRLSN